MANDRPNPDELLARVRAEESRAGRGKLRVFFGYAAGVGKTYAMLEAARREKAEGVDVVVGYVEPHGRPETEALLLGLEHVPVRPVPYQGVTLREFDLDAALNLLDELVTGRPAYQPHAIAILKARVLARQGDVAAALALLDAILAQTDNLEGRRLEAQYRRAEILWQSGDTQQAAGELTEILRHERLFRVSDDERQWIRLADQALQAIA